MDSPIGSQIEANPTPAAGDLDAIAAPGRLSRQLYVPEAKPASQSYPTAREGKESLYGWRLCSGQKIMLPVDGFGRISRQERLQAAQQGLDMTKNANLADQLDEFDLRILSALQENNQRTSEQLAELVHLSSASCLRRMRRLREIKAIVADVSIVAPEVVGPRMTMIVLVSLEREQHDLLDAFKASIRTDPQVRQCYYVTGTVDFVLLISVRDVADYEEFTRRFFIENRNVKRFETLVVMNCVKYDLGVRLPVARND